MSKIAIVYWSGTGNTEAMANSVLAGAQAAGAQAELFTAAEFGPEKLAEYDAAAFGCPAMGAEQLEEDEFEPMFSACKAALKGKKTALFGSYGWATGSGCAPGKRLRRAAAPRSPARASSAPTRPTPPPGPPARRWGRLWPSNIDAASRAVVYWKYQGREAPVCPETKPFRYLSRSARSSS